MSDVYQDAAGAIKNARSVIASTGAGISVESGIDAFRGPGGIWTKYPPEEYATIDAFLANPAKVWGLWHELGKILFDVKPNPAHEALAELEAMELLSSIVTQNVDNLHQDAGSQGVVEYHGNARRLKCMECRTTTPFAPEKKEYENVPHCACGGLLKPDVVMFGETIPPDAMMEAERLAQNCDVVIIVGTSAQVYPAAQLPVTAKHNGAYIIEANIEKTDFTNTITDAFLEGPAGQTLPKLIRHIKGEA